MKDEILKLLDNNKYEDDNGKSKKRNATSLDEMEIFKGLNKKFEVDLSEVCTLIREMEKKGEIYRTKSGKFTLYKFTDLKTGRLTVNKMGFGYVIMDDGSPDVHVFEYNINRAIHNDVVAIEVDDRNGKIEGKVVRILERSLDVIVGEYIEDDLKGIINIDNSKIKLKIIIDEKDKNNALAGHKVLVEPYEKINDNTYKGKVVKILGHKDDPGVDILSIAAENDIDNDFCDEAEEEVKKLPDKVLTEDLVDREDLRNEMIFTIDGDDAKDFDDAVSIKRLPNGNYLLGVHIADVDHYVKEGSAIYKEALRKGTSTYLLDTVFNMLSKKLSNGICSLKPNVDRLTVSYEMEIDANGKTLNDRIFESVINSKKRMTYKDVNRVYAGENVEGYEDYKESLFMMKDLSEIIRKSKERRGSIEFDIPEILIHLDEEKKPIGVGFRERGISEKVIEDFMIKTNETNGTYMKNLDIPFIYRTHEKPKEEKVRDFINILNALGFKIKADIKRINSKGFQDILDQVKEQISNKCKDEELTKKIYQVISESGLKSMPKAIYSIDVNVGHFGLASICYAQVTSPIRRFPDLVNQNITKKVLKGKITSIEELNELREKLVYLAEHSTLKERNSIQCERDVNDMKTAEYMQNYIGEHYSGIVSGVERNRIYIRLDNLVEGSIHINDLEGDKYIHNEKMHAIIGKTTKKKYTIGSQVDIEVIAASKEERTIDFALVKSIGRKMK